MAPPAIDTQGSYDRVAEEYAALLYAELDHKPLDRALLDAFAEEVRGRGPIGDVGCGPGQIARYLHSRQLPVVGIDLSDRMIALARRRYPAATFLQGDMLALPIPDGVWAGLVAFYSIIHLTPEEVPRAFGEFRRVLRSGGLVLLAFHIGHQRLHRDEMWGAPVALDFQFLDPGNLAALLTAAGFVVEMRLERQPYTAVEHPSQRGYLLARRAP